MLVDLGMTLEAALAAQGVALARPTLAASWLAGGQLRPVIGPQATPARQYGVRHGGGQDARDFAAWLARRCDRKVREAHALLSGLI
jgi:DNA-binding transcriptional LysR family regulator